MHKHYIRLQDGKIVAGFSDAFEEPQEGDILIAEDAQRHFILNDEINPALIDEQGIALFKYEKGKILERAKKEITTDIAKMPKPELSELEQLKIRVEKLENKLKGRK